MEGPRGVNKRLYSTELLHLNSLAGPCLQRGAPQPKTTNLLRAALFSQWVYANMRRQVFSKNAKLVEAAPTAPQQEPAKLLRDTLNENPTTFGGTYMNARGPQQEPSNFWRIQ